jgi:phage tail tape-measure protein
MNSGMMGGGKRLQGTALAGMAKYSEVQTKADAQTDAMNKAEEANATQTNMAIGTMGGAAAGATYGAMAGSIVPGAGTMVGAVVGGAIGGLIGMFGGSLF